MRSLLATIWLAFSIQFFFNAVDGEEFIFGILFLLIAVRLLLVSAEPGNIRHLLLSIFCFALATGCRPELVFAAIIFPLYCLVTPKLGWKYALISIALSGIAVVIVWLPVLFIGIRAPYTAGMNLRESVLGGAYRIIFQAFTPPVFLLLSWVLICALRDLRKLMESKNFIFTMSCVVPMIFLAVF